MARRRGGGQSAAAGRLWRVGVYIRLSREDGAAGESESVANQRELIARHIAGLDDGDRYLTAGEYVDDGVSGTTDGERPAFQRLLADIEAGLVNCVVVKDLARSFRNYSDQGYYLDDWFARRGVRFISLFHQPLDSYREPRALWGIAVPIQGVLNENHCAETSEKIRAVFDVKRRSGKHIGSFAAYGWVKSPDDKNALALDPEAAAVIRLIGEMLLDGESLAGAARCLNERGVLCPSAYKRETLGLKYENPSVEEGRRPLWCASVIRRLMTNPMLRGDLVQGRTRVKSYKLHLRESVPPEEWYVVRDAIPAVMDADRFERIQRALARDARAVPGSAGAYALSGFLRCGDCGAAMCRSGAGERAYYYCRTYRERSRTACTKHALRHDRLEAAVLKAIRRELSSLGDGAALLERARGQKWPGTLIVAPAEAAARCERELKKLARYRLKLYQDWKDGEISEEEYRAIGAEYAARQQFLLAAAAERQRPCAGAETPRELTAEDVRRLLAPERLTRALTAALIDTVYVYEGGRIRIKFNFSAP